MQLTGLHLLLTYQCTLKCDHCFTWGSPWQHGTMTLADIRGFLRQAKEVGGIERIAFEGGEPFLFYATLLEGTRAAAALGFEVSIVTERLLGRQRGGRRGMPASLRRIAAAPLREQRCAALAGDAQPASAACPRRVRAVGHPARCAAARRIRWRPLRKVHVHNCRAAKAESCSAGVPL